MNISYLPFPSYNSREHTRGMPILVQFSEGYITISTENGPAQSNKAQGATTATTAQSTQTGKSQYNTTVRITHSAQFITEQTSTVRTTQPAQVTEANDNTTVRTTNNSTQLSEAKLDSLVGMAKKTTSKPELS